MNALRRTGHRVQPGDELERLVDDGETLELVAKMNALARAPQRVDSARTSSTI